MRCKIYFIVTCGRSGSTSLSRILDIATNGRCLIEPVPDLTIESRSLIEGCIDNPRQILVEQMFPRIAQTLDESYIYGEKNLTLGPFIPYLYEMLKCKFVFLIRDGRDVVTSFLNWHNKVYGNIYRECKETGNLAETVREAIANLPVEKDTYDYSRPRPGPSDPFYEEWADFSRFEMVSWYWAYTNRLIYNNLSQVPEHDWIMINYTGVTATDIKRIFDFIGLAGFDKRRVTGMLKARANSVEDALGMKKSRRVFGKKQSYKNRFPSWHHWDSEQNQRFNRIAHEVMQLFNYYD